MADSVFNIAKGRVVEFYNRVENNDPAASALIVVVLQSTGLETHALLRDYDTLAAVIAGASAEATNAGYARIVLTDVELAALPAPDDGNDWYQVDIPDQTWTGVAGVGGAWGMILICYDADTAGGTDANIIPLTMHDFAVTPDGSDITAQINAAGFFRAS